MSNEAVTTKNFELISDGADRFLIFTPYILGDGDHVPVVLKKEQDSWVLSDEGFTYGCLIIHESLLTDDRMNFIAAVLSEIGAVDRDGELILKIEWCDIFYRVPVFAETILKILEYC